LNNVTISGNLEFRFYKNGRVSVKSDNVLLGTAWVFDMMQPSVYLSKIDFPARYQRKKYGTALMQHIFEHFSNKESITLHVEERNTCAIAFYRSLGFFISNCNNQKGWDLSRCSPHYMMTRRLNHA
jgi:ribosomal protein S18 acetylase RimI-like enzyme